jgi:hypothetical protein
MRFVFKIKKLHEKKKKKLYVLINLCFSGILIYFCFFRSKSGLQQYFWQIIFTGDHDIVGEKMLEYTFLMGNSLHTGST